MAATRISAERMAALLGNKFGHPCPVHNSAPVSRHSIRCRFFCLDCRELRQEALCSLCRENHLSHRILQVRQVSFKEVVRTEDIKGLFDITGIQQHSINQSQVVHLTRWASNGPFMGFKRGQKMSECLVCKRRLIGAAWFCSVECKVEMKECSTLDHTGDTEGIHKHRSLCDMYYDTPVKRRKLLVDHKCSLKKENVASSSSLRVQDGTPSMCSFDKEATLPKSRHDATPSVCSLNKEDALPKSPRKGRPTRAPFY